MPKNSPGLRVVKITPGNQERFVPKAKKEPKPEIQPGFPDMNRHAIVVTRHSSENETLH
jgi:hypothetical protein